jgi:hypothetical protein
MNAVGIAETIDNFKRVLKSNADNTDSLYQILSNQEVAAISSAIGALEAAEALQTKRKEVHPKTAVG